MIDIKSFRLLSLPVPASSGPHTGRFVPAVSNMRLLLLVPFAFGLNAFAQKLADQQFPHLIIPVDKRAPDKALGTQKRGYVEHAVRKVPNIFINPAYSDHYRYTLKFPSTSPT
jgi:hypothetical protein